MGLVLCWCCLFGCTLCVAQVLLAVFFVVPPRGVCSTGFLDDGLSGIVSLVNFRSGSRAIPANVERAWPCNPNIVLYVPLHGVRNPYSLRVDDVGALLCAGTLRISVCFVLMNGI